MVNWMGFWVVILFGIVSSKWGVESFEFDEVFRKNRTRFSFLESISYLDTIYGVSAAAPPANALMVGLTLIQGAAAKGAGTYIFPFPKAL